MGKVYVPIYVHSYRNALLLNPSVSVCSIVFTLVLNLSISSSVRILSGSAFQSLGPAYSNVRRPTQEYIVTVMCIYVYYYTIK